MKLIRYFLAFYFLLSCSQGRCELIASKIQNEGKYYLAICAMFQDEADYLKEWIEYHRMVGVKHFYLYNNNSDDHYIDILSPYISKGIVDLVEWSRPNKEDYWLDDQKKAYKHCLEKCSGKVTWLAIIDIDEFIVPVIDPDLISFLSEFDHHPFLGEIRMNWQLYGTSGLKTLPKNKLLIESLLRKAPTYYMTSETPHNGVVKSIVRPHAVKNYRAHEGDLKNSYYSYPFEFIGTKRIQEVQVDRIRVNHYWTRAEDFFYDVKIGRRLTYLEPSYYNVMLQKFKDLNRVKDDIMLKFVPKLRKRMKMTP